MPINQIDNIESQIWNNDIRNFFVKNTYYLGSAAPTIFDLSDDNLFKVSRLINGAFLVQGKLVTRGEVALTLNSPLTIGILPTIFNQYTIVRKITPQIIVDRDNIGGTDDFIVGVSVDNDTKSIILHGRSETLLEDDDLYISLSFSATKNIT